MSAREGDTSADVPTRLPATVVLVPGGWGGSWIWEGVVSALAERGVPSLACDLASVGNDPSRLGGLHADARAVRAMLDKIHRPAVLCAHSYGGMVISEAAAGPHRWVRHLVYIAAYVGDEGETFLEATRVETDSPPDLLSAAILRDDGTVVLDLDKFVTYIARDVGMHRANELASKHKPMSLAIASEPLAGAAWRDLPSTYVICTKDTTAGIGYFRGMAERAGSTLEEIESDHWPMLSRTDSLAELLAKIARAASQ